MVGEVIRRDFGVTVVDHAITRKEDVEALLNRAVDLMREGAPPAMLYYMSNFPDGIEGVDARALAAHCISIAPPGLRIALIHHADRLLISLGEEILDEYRKHGIAIEMFGRPDAGEAWLRSRATSAETDAPAL